jgi:hypothetical protein
MGFLLDNLSKRCSQMFQPQMSIFRLFSNQFIKFKTTIHPSLLPWAFGTNVLANANQLALHALSSIAVHVLPMQHNLEKKLKKLIKKGK